MAEKGHSGIIRTYALAVILAVIFFVGSSVFISYMMNQNKKENIRYLFDVAKQNSLAIQTQTTGDFQTLTSLAVSIKYVDWDDVENMKHILSEINDQNAFIRMGYADTDGKATFLTLEGKTYENIDVSEDEVYIEAMKGNPWISKTRKDDLQGGYVNTYGVPITHNGKIYGVLLASNRAEIFANIVGSSVMNGMGYSNIIDQSGNYVIQSEKARKKERDVLSLQELGTIDQATLLKVNKDLKAGKDGSFSYRNKAGTLYWGVYEPIGINDLYVLSVVPDSALRKYFKATKNGIMFFIIMVMFFFAFLFHRIHKLDKKGQMRLEYLAYQDALTGDSSPTKFNTDVQEIIEKGEFSRYAIWYADIKKFKYLNDMLGYQTGDDMLRNMSAVLRTKVPKEMTFCRISADNFAGILNSENMEELNLWFDQLIKDIENIQTAKASGFHVEMTIGVYCFSRDDGLCYSVDNMINWANMTQKEAKKKSGSQVAYYSETLREKVREETELEASMEQAMEQEEFLVYFQPKVSIQGKIRIAGAEALVRWRRNGKGIVPPSNFIPLFEKNGFIVKLDRYMFEKVCTWYEEYAAFHHPEIRLATNVSRLGILQEDFIEYYVSVKKKHHIPDGVLELEFTESIIMNNEKLFQNTVSQLKANGFTCSLDDFGSGYSSLNILKDLPIDVLKLDLIFFHKDCDLDRSKIVISSVISMARRLHMKTIAEGVEEWQQVEFLKETGCDVIQGYVFGKPMPVHDFEEFCEKRIECP